MKDKISKKRPDESAQLPPVIHVDSFIYGSRRDDFYLYSLSQKVDEILTKINWSK